MVKDEEIKNIQVKLNYFNDARKLKNGKLTVVDLNSCLGKYYAPQAINSRIFLIESDIWSAGRLFFDMVFCGFGKV